MATKRESNRAGQDSNRAIARATSSAQRLQNLRRRFWSFRRRHKPGTRIPQMLRDAALLALRTGIPEAEVRQACGITKTQLRQWQRTQGPNEEKSESEGQMVRVFPVVEEEIEIPPERSSEQASPGISLSIGGWDIFIRRDGE